MFSSISISFNSRTEYLSAWGRSPRKLAIFLRLTHHISTIFTLVSCKVRGRAFGNGIGTKSGRSLTPCLQLYLRRNSFSPVFICFPPFLISSRCGFLRKNFGAQVTDDRLQSDRAQLQACGGRFGRVSPPAWGSRGHSLKGPSVPFTHL